MRECPFNRSLAQECPSCRGLTTGPGGLPGERIKRVVGYAATYPFVRHDPYSSLNRRVSIVIKEKKLKAEEEGDPYEKAVGDLPF